jgi:ribosome-associated heat shock protein Hsp15
MVRVDKWLWAVRVYKTRSLATDACRRGHILVNGLTAKPSKEVKEKDQVTVRKLPVLYSFIVKQAIEKRISAKLIHDCIEDITSVEELDKLKVKETYFIRRDRGTGRPTKKERRLLDELDDNIFID